VVLALQAPKNLVDAHEIRTLRDKAKAADAAAAAGKNLTDEQKADQKAWEEKRKESKPDQKKIQKEIDDYRGGYPRIVGRRLGETSMWNSTFFYRFTFFDTAGMMLIGMGLYKLGVFSAARSSRFYAWTVLAGYGVGVPLNWLIGNWRIAAGFDPLMMPLSFTSYDAGRLSVALGHVGVFMLAVRLGLMQWLTSRLAAVGQMALSNYLLTSLICTTIFYGYGFGQFARLERHQLMYVVLAVWTVNLVASPIWLRYFRFGPVEWLWRSLTYWQRQPMRIGAVAALAIPSGL